MKHILTIALISFSAHVFAAGAPTRSVAESQFTIKPGPNWHFIPGKKATIALPTPGKILFGSNGNKLPAFDEWKSNNADELVLYPGYKEPQIVDPATQESTRKDLNVFEARFAFIVNKPIEKFSKENFATKSFLEHMDPEFVQREIGVESITPTGDNISDAKPWCQSPRTLCLEASFEFSSVVSKVIQYGYKALKKDNPPTGILLESELQWNDESESAALRVMDSEVRSLTQKTFYIDHYFQYAVTNLIFQKVDEQTTLVVGVAAIGIQSDILNMGGDIFDSVGLSNLDARAFIINGTGIPGLSAVENGLIPYTKEKAINLRTYIESL